MSNTLAKEALVEGDIDDEASVVEILRALKRHFTEEDEASLKHWLCAYFAQQVEEGALGFYIDEFGAKDVLEIDSQNGLKMLNESDIWNAEHDVMLHPFYLV